MNNQEKKEYLQKYLEAVAAADRLDGEIRKWRSTAERTTTTIRLVPAGGGGGDRLQSAVEQIDDLTRELAEKRAETVQLRRDIEDIITTVEDERLQRLLRYRYIDDMKWEAIAVKMDYSWRQVLRLHGDALQAIKLS